MIDDRALACDYDDPMSERMLGIGADVLRSFGGAVGGRHLAIVGGAVPSLLVAELPVGIAPHVGTADLDLHLSLHLLDGETSDYDDAIIDGLLAGAAPGGAGRAGDQVALGGAPSGHVPAGRAAVPGARGSRPRTVACRTTSRWPASPRGCA